MRIPSRVVVSVALVSALAFASPAFAQNPVGVWKMNPAKSKYSPGPAPKRSTITVTAAAGGSFNTDAQASPSTT